MKHSFFRQNLRLSLICIICLSFYSIGYTQNFPKPKIELEVNSRLYPLDSKIPIPRGSRVGIKLILDSAYLASTPNAVSYRISSVDVFAQLSLGLPTKVFTIKTGNRDASETVLVSLGTKVRQAKPGIRLFVKLNHIYWIDENGKKNLDNRFSPQEKTFSFVTR